MRRSVLFLAVLLPVLALAALLAGCVPLRPYSAVRQSVPAAEFVRVKGQLVHVVQSGAGDPVVLLHGFGASAWSWRKVMPALAASHRVVAIDLNGFGYTERPKDPAAYSREGQAALVLGTMDALGIGRAHLVGHSYGGGLSLFLAWRHPERVRSLVLVDSSAPTFPEDRRSRAAGLRPLNRLFVHGFALQPGAVRKALKRSLYDDSLVTPELLEGYLEPLLVEGVDDAFYGLTAPNPSPGPPVVLEEIRVPTLAVWGAEDELISVEDGRRAAARIPGSRFVTIEKCGHLAMEEKPEELLAAMLPFLANAPDVPAASNAADGGAEDRPERAQWLLGRLRDPGRAVPYDAAARAARSWRAWAGAKAGVLAGEDWREVGPRNFAGRVISVAAGSNGALWAGSAGGGLWRSDDFGTTWRQRGGDRLPSLWIGALAIDPRNPDVLYMGTGEGNAPLIGYGGFGGLLKTTDGGLTFRELPLPEASFFRTVVSRADSALVLTAAETGLYRSEDGGAHFAKTLAGRITDLAQDPRDAARFLAVRMAASSGADGGLFESVDAGRTWRAAGTGLPPGVQWGRAAVAFAPAISAASSAAYLAVDRFAGGPELFRSADGGRTWEPRASDGAAGYQAVGPYGAHLEVAPTDESFLVQANGLSILVSRDAGLHWTVPAGSWHTDTHGIAFVPGRPERLAVATDGGVAVSGDGGATFDRADRGFPTVQAYACAVVPGGGYVVGTQDDSILVHRGDPGGAFEFTRFLQSGDTSAVSVNPVRPSEIVALATAGRNPGLSTDGGRTWVTTRDGGILAGDTFPWVTRLARSPLHPERLYLGGSRLYVSEDGGRSWRPVEPRPPGRLTIADVAVSPVDDREIWTVWTDGAVLVSVGGGETWTDRSPPNDGRSGVRIAAGPAPGTAYAILSGTSGPRLFRTRDGGAAWVDVGAGLPDLALNAVLPDPRRDGDLWVATDAGVAASTDGGATWADASGSLPRTVVTDLCLEPVSGRMAAATYGRGLWELAAAPSAAPCTADGETLCLNDGRFEVKATWQTADASGTARAVALTADTGYLWFFDPANVEVVVKVLRGCEVNGRYWVFAGGLTNVRVALTVRDTRTGAVKSYANPRGTAFQPVQDTGAFATCP